MVAVIQPIIGNPHPFNINFQNVGVENHANPTLLQKIKNVAAIVFEYIKIIGSSIKEACVTSIRYLPETFRVAFAGRIRSPEEFLFRMGAFVVLQISGIFVITVYLGIKKAKALPRALSQWADNRLQLAHLKQKSTVIETNHIPAQITVSSLNGLFHAINFDNSNAPGYMSPESMREGNITYNANQLHRQLEVFIDRVNNREAFLGTPPAYAPAQLMQFYVQIENAVRFSIEKVERDYNTFVAAHGHVSKEHGQYQEYNDLLQARSRLVIDLAIAGAHCGARYMGDSMEAYYFHKGEGTESGTLKEQINKFLATKRLEIARSHIPAYLGNDTHQYAAYMAELGPILGIPDTENVVEHLRGVDRATLIEHFFVHNPHQPDLKVYNSAYIREELQNKIKGKNAQSFRELIFDWIKGQAGDWRKAEFDAKSAEAFSAVATIQQPERPVIFKQLEIFVKLLDNAPNSPATQEWNDFLSGLFSTSEAKALIDAELGTVNKNPMEKMTARNALKTALSEIALIPQLQKLVAKTTTLDAILPFAKSLSWAKEVNKELAKHEVTAAPITSLMECGNDKTKVKNLIKEQVEQQRAILFLESVTKVSDDEEAAVSVEKEGLKPAVLEWLLVSHEVLTPPAQPV